jgi:Putative F0F1-ATPase subunit Ca2+/Mg2+ transporter
MQNDYIRYSTMVFEMAAIIGAFTFAGYKADAWQHTSTPYYTLAGALLGVGLALYYTLKEFINPPKS